jgi:hypothetical protein
MESRDKVTEDRRKLQNKNFVDLIIRLILLVRLNRERWWWEYSTLGTNKIWLSKFIKNPEEENICEVSVWDTANTVTNWRFLQNREIHLSPEQISASKEYCVGLLFSGFCGRGGERSNALRHISIGRKQVFIAAQYNRPEVLITKSKQKRPLWSCTGGLHQN